jgi:5'-nucleotidase
LSSGKLASKDQNSSQSAALPTKLLGRLNSSSSLSIVEEDPIIVEKLSRYKNQIQSKANQMIGSIGEDLRHIRVPLKTYDGIDGGALPFGSELAPIVAASFYDAALQADACLQNAGGIRSGLGKGSITIGDVYNLLPFSNTLVLIELSGSEIKQLLEEALINFADNKGSDGSFPYAYALRYDINMSSPKNKRVSGIEIKNRASGKWSPLDMNRKYTIAVNSYIAEGRDGYTTLAEVQQARGKGLDTYLDYAMSFANYIQKQKSITRLPSDERCIKNFHP